MDGSILFQWLNTVMCSHTCSGVWVTTFLKSHRGKCWTLLGRISLKLGYLFPPMHVIRWYFESKCEVSKKCEDACIWLNSIHSDEVQCNAAPTLPQGFRGLKTQAEYSPTGSKAPEFKYMQPHPNTICKFGSNYLALQISVKSEPSRTAGKSHLS